MPAKDLSIRCPWKRGWCRLRSCCQCQVQTPASCFSCLQNAEPAARKPRAWGCRTVVSNGVQIRLAGAALMPALAMRWPMVRITESAAWSGEPGLGSLGCTRVRRAVPHRDLVC